MFKGILDKVSSFETVVSVCVLLGGATLVTYLTNAVKEHFPIFSDMPWQGWALLFITVLLVLGLFLSIIADCGASAFRKIKPLPSPATVGIKIYSFFVGSTEEINELHKGEFTTLLTLGVKAWSNGKVLYPSDFKVHIIHEGTSYIGFNRVSQIPIRDNSGGVIYEHGNTLQDLLDINGATEKPQEGSLTFICNAPHNVFTNRSTGIRLTAESTIGGSYEFEVKIGDL